MKQEYLCDKCFHRTVCEHKREFGKLTLAVEAIPTKEPLAVQITCKNYVTIRSISADGVRYQNDYF